MLQIEKTGVNMISKDYQQSLKGFEPGETKYFQMLNGIPNNDPDPTEKAKRPILFGHTQIPTQDRIKDPFSKQHVIIGVVEDFVAETGFVTKWKLFVPNMHLPQSPGKFSLVEGNQDHEELYEYLQMCNYNRDNPNRDKKVEALFYEIVQPKVNFDAFPKEKVKPKPQVVETA